MTLDLSFISVLKVMPAVVGVVAPQGVQLVVLIKPQFEAGRAQVSAGGVVRDPKVRREAAARPGAGGGGGGWFAQGWPPPPQLQQQQQQLMRRMQEGVSKPCWRTPLPTVRTDLRHRHRRYTRR